MITGEQIFIFMQGLQILVCQFGCACVCVRLQKDKLYTNVMLSYLLSACVSLAGFGNLMQDVLWCFSQVKGTIDIGVTEGKFIFPFVAVIKKNLFVLYILPNQCAGGVVRMSLEAAGKELSYTPLVSAFIKYLCI